MKTTHKNFLILFIFLISCNFVSSYWTDDAETGNATDNDWYNPPNPNADTNISFNYSEDIAFEGSRSLKITHYDDVVGDQAIIRLTDTPLNATLDYYVYDDGTDSLTNIPSGWISENITHQSPDLYLVVDEVVSNITTNQVGWHHVQLYLYPNGTDFLAYYDGVLVNSGDLATIGAMSTTFPNRTGMGFYTYQSGDDTLYVDNIQYYAGTPDNVTLPSSPPVTPTTGGYNNTYNAEDAPTSIIDGIAKFIAGLASIALLIGIIIGGAFLYGLMKKIR